MQMGEIPMLNRRQEVAVAKRINYGRRRFRYCMLATDYLLQAAVDCWRGSATTGFAWTGRSKCRSSISPRRRGC